jgi:hypothetical protein
MQTQIQSVADRYERQYGDKPVDYRIFDGRDPREVLARLKALPSTATAEDVLAILDGNWSWLVLQCNECERYTLPVVELGEEPDYESATVWLCRDCAAKALEAFGAEEAFS